MSNCNETYSRMIALLTHFHEKGIRVALSETDPSKIVLAGQLETVTKESVAELRGMKADVLAYLQRVQPELKILAVAKNLAMVWLDPAIFGQVITVEIREIQYYRLTPRTYVWFRQQIGDLLAKSDGALDAQIIGTWKVIDTHTQRHFLAHEILAEMSQKRGLPVPEKSPGFSPSWQHANPNITQGVNDGDAASEM